MQRYLIILFCFLLCTTCDDGDILTVDLEFDDNLNLCEDFENSYLLYNSKEDPNEALILIFPRDENSNLFFEPENADEIIDSLSINGENIRFIYRTYNRTPTKDDFCAVVPPSDLIIREDYEAQSGTVRVIVTSVDDDNDGIPSADEDLNGNGNLEDDDSDGDGIPNYLDRDDDGDNIQTIDEDNDEDGDGNPFTNPRNTDGTDEVDYLDTDDDNDGALTRLEDQNGNKSPLDDSVVNDAGVDVLRYLYNNPIAMEEFPDPGLQDNVYKRTVSVRFEILNAGLEIINSTFIDFGTFQGNTQEITRVFD